ncbi:MAG: hypothetical protein QOI74_1785, partial [Micromonosporaceae bacterium]|nr:hypothetical protein [Micromonosporaceae bacterium]
MAKRAVEVRECDRCGKEPAHTWQITGPDGAPREIELCEQHASPVANAYALARPVPKKTPQRDAAAARRRRYEPEPTPGPAGKSP